MWKRTAAILLALGLLGAFGLGYLPAPIKNDSIRQSQYELTRLVVLILLLGAWGATMLYWRIRFCRQTPQTKLGTIIAVLGLLATLGLNYLPTQVPAQAASVNRTAYDVMQQYALRIEYPLLTASAFLLLVVGATTACWRSKERQEVDARTEVRTEAQPAADSNACDGQPTTRQGQISQQHGHKRRLVSSR